MVNPVGNDNGDLYVNPDENQPGLPSNEEPDEITKEIEAEIAREKLLANKQSEVSQTRSQTFNALGNNATDLIDKKEDAYTAETKAKVADAFNAVAASTVREAAKDNAVAKPLYVSAPISASVSPTQFSFANNLADQEKTILKNGSKSLYPKNKEHLVPLEPGDDPRLGIAIYDKTTKETTAIAGRALDRANENYKKKNNGKSLPFQVHLPNQKDPILSKVHNTIKEEDFNVIFTLYTRIVEQRIALKILQEQEKKAKEEKLADALRQYNVKVLDQATEKKEREAEQALQNKRDQNVPQKPAPVHTEESETVLDRLSQEKKARDKKLTEDLDEKSRIVSHKVLIADQDKRDLETQNTSKNQESHNTHKYEKASQKSTINGTYNILELAAAILDGYGRIESIAKYAFHKFNPFSDLPTKKLIDLHLISKR